mmetsp:Transcript_23270/g.53830  ORF Transcript_23270/g.53830 Transcript_23270/m.53830 type:complete len:264 (-) Transcript_23270:282-1073(-)
MARLMALSVCLTHSCAHAYVLGSSAMLSRAAPLPRTRSAATVLCALETEVAAPSFVQTEMRGAAMKLHTRDQSREGERAAVTPVSAWAPQRADYLQFLVDSRAVYACFEELVDEAAALAPLRDCGLERVEALDSDIAWFVEQGVPEPEPAQPGSSYVQLLREMAAAGQWTALVCHFYNFYFAHTAGGRMIGKMMAAKLLDGRTLNFYEWPRGDVDKELLPSLRSRIDAMAGTWSREEKDECLAETGPSFKYGGALLGHIKGPQ